ncbi:MAG: signal peptidase II [Candidatus Coproplasma sp.]
MKEKKFKLEFGKISAVMIVVFVVLLAADLVLKWCEEAYFWNFTVIPGLITVESGVRNPGAAFSFLANAEWGQTFLIIITVIMLVVLVACFVIIPERFPLLKLALAMVVSGAVGNLVDRIMFGNVRDFVWVNMLGNWACCNFADFWIVFGVIIAAVDLLFLNEWAVFPLTKRAKAAQAKTKDNKEAQSLTENSATENTESAPENAESATENSESVAKTTESALKNGEEDK